MKSGEMKHDMILFPIMGTNRNVLFQTHLLFVTMYGLVWNSNSSVKLLTQYDAGPFESPLLPCTPLYLVLVSGLRLNISPIRKFRHKLNLGLLERTNINLNYLNTTKLIDELLLAKMICVSGKRVKCHF